MSELLRNDALVEFAFKALDHGVGSIEHGGPLIPFTLSEGPDGIALQRFVADDFRDAVEQARGSFADADGLVRGALAYEAYITLEDERSDAVIVEFYERGDEQCGLFAQRFRPGSEAHPLEPVGNPAFIGEQAPLF